MKLLSTSTGKWEEERLLLWAEIAQMKKRMKESEAREKKQIDAAHQKIRGMESWKWKSWAASAAASFLGVLVIVLLKLLFEHK
jgi:VIT1/CCC1 family predicted Fe2+/Mn2+ transporter